MRMAELSSSSGVPVATIKYYLREGLLPPGQRTSPNQASYDERHLRRLRLVRALLDVGGLSIARVKDVLGAIDEPEPSWHHILGIAQYGISQAAGGVSAESREWASGLAQAMAGRRGWELKPEHPAVESLLGVLCTLGELGSTELLERLDDYAELADRIADTDFRTLREMSTLEDVVEQAVVGTVLGDVLLAALRRIAQQNLSARTYRADPAQSSGSS